MKLLTVTKEARQAVGAVSAMYTGATTEASPMPNPVSNLPAPQDASRLQWEEAGVISRATIMKSYSENERAVPPSIVAKNSIRLKESFSGCKRPFGIRINADTSDPKGVLVHEEPWHIK